MYCSLAAGINGKGFDNKALAWWITLLHHICSVLELGTLEGCISVLPNYADVTLKNSNMPSWATLAYNRIRKSMSREEIGRRWAYLQKSVIPTWHFYAMPHSYLSSLGDERPSRPYWPTPGEREQDVLNRCITILTQGKSGTLPRSWVSRAKVDGYDFSPKEDAREAKVKTKEVRQKNQENKDIHEEEPAHEKTYNSMKDDTSMQLELDDGK